MMISRKQLEAKRNVTNILRQYKANWHPLRLVNISKQTKLGYNVL